MKSQKRSAFILNIFLIFICVTVVLTTSCQQAIVHKEAASKESKALALTAKDKSSKDYDAGITAVGEKLPEDTENNKRIDENESIKEIEKEQNVSNEIKETPKYPQIKLTGFTQLQFLSDESAGIDDEFKVHRARAGVTGRLNEDIGYNLIFGAVEPPDRDPHLVNAYADFDYIPGVKIRVGQFLVPFGLEGPETIYFNPAIERSTAVRRLNPFNIFRDAGIQASSKFEKFNYALAVVNGSGANISENNDYKDVLGRFGFTPLEALSLGLSGHWGKYVGDSVENLDRFRLGTDFEYLKNPIRARGEFIWREDEQVSGAYIDKWGWYILGGYRFFQKLEGILRYEEFDPNTDANYDRLDITTLGLNYYFIGNTRLSVNYEFRNDDADADIDNFFTAQLQIVF